MHSEVRSFRLKNCKEDRQGLMPPSGWTRGSIWDLDHWESLRSPVHSQTGLNNRASATVDHFPAGHVPSGP